MKSVTPFYAGVAAICLSGVTMLVISLEARSPSDAPPSKIVIGKVSEVEGEYYMAKDPHGEDTLKMVDKSYVITSQAGEEVRLELSHDTKVRNRVNPGDRVEANISPEGHTLSVTRIE